MKVKDFLLNEIKSGEYRLNTDDLELILDCCTDIIHFEDGSMIDQYRMDEEGFRKVREYFIEGVAVK